MSGEQPPGGNAHPCGGRTAVHAVLASGLPQAVAMTTPSQPTREDADRWWENCGKQERAFLNYADHREHRRFAHPKAWWRSLPDERAIAIHLQETQR